MANSARKLSVINSSPLGVAVGDGERSSLGVAAGHSSKARSRQSRPKDTSTPRVVRTKASKRREELLSYCVGAGCLVGLMLSGYDSALSINHYIHIEWNRSVMMAIVVDFLLVGAELAVLFSPCPKVNKSAHLYIRTAGSLSIVLNASEFARHGQNRWEMALCGATGAIIPLLLLVSSKYSGSLYLSSKQG
jgi:hypothetical protein